MSAAVEAESFPGAELVLPGLDDLAAGRETLNALAVLVAADRLRQAGFEVPPDPSPRPAAHRLYELIAAQHDTAAHTRFNAICGRIASFARSAERARSG